MEKKKKLKISFYFHFKPLKLLREYVKIFILYSEYAFTKHSFKAQLKFIYFLSISLIPFHRQCLNIMQFYSYLNLR